MASKAGASGFKLYISNLNWTTGHKQLQEYFSKFGHVVKSIVVFDKETGMSRGYGFVTFSTERSLNILNEESIHRIEGHTLRISTAKKSD